MQQSQDIEPVTLSEVLELDTWNRRRGHEELRAFIMDRHHLIGDEE